MSDWRKDFRYGTCVIWPQGVTARVANQLRARYDGVSQRHCAAHITITQPFLADPDDKALETIQNIVSSVPSFSIYAGPIEPFGDSNVLKFDIHPKSILLTLRKRLHDTGLFNLSLPFTEGFIPHMTISECGLPGGESLQALVKELNKDVPPTMFQVTALAYIRPDPSFHFKEAHAFALGASLPPGKK